MENCVIISTVNTLNKIQLEEVLLAFRSETSSLIEDECYQLISSMLSNGKDPLKVLTSILGTDTELSYFLKRHYL